TLSPMRITAEPCACFAILPVSMEMDFPPASWTVVSCFLSSSFLYRRARLYRRCRESAEGCVGQISKLPGAGKSNDERDAREFNFRLKSQWSNAPCITPERDAF